MSILQAFEHGKQHSNIAHFAAMARMAAADGIVNKEEEELLLKMAEKLDIGEHMQAEILKDPSRFPLEPMFSRVERLERLHDLFRLIYIDHDIDDGEISLIKRYAVGLGCNARKADQVIRKSMEIFGGQISLDDYLLLMERE
jgi:uncharacterized tellurite resistance protein B-like protein